MSKIGRAEFLEKSKRIIMEAVNQLGEVGMELMVEGKLGDEELIKLIDVVIDALHSASKTAQSLHGMSNDERVDAVEKIMDEYMRKGGDPKGLEFLNSYGKSKRSSPSRQSFQPPVPKDDPYNHT